MSTVLAVAANATQLATRRTRQEAHKLAAAGVIPGLVLAAAGVAIATIAARWLDALPVIVAAVVVGVLLGNIKPMAGGTALGARVEMKPGLKLASTTVLRFGIVLLGLRLSVGDVAALGWSTLFVLVVTVSVTFFGVQWIGRRMGLSPGLSLLVASGFSICGNSAIASVSGAIDSDEDDVAASVGLVTLCGTLAILVIPAIGSALGLDPHALGIWTGASVQDTAQVIAVASAAGPSVLAVATAVKLTRVLFLAPIVTGVSIHAQRSAGPLDGARPPLVPVFVIGFIAALLVRTAGIVPLGALDIARSVEGYALAAGMVGLGTSVRLGSLRQLGLKPLALGGAAWLVVGAVSLAAIQLAV